MNVPHIARDATHQLWWRYADRPFDKETFNRVTDGAFFQKTAYKTESAKNPIPGSFADIMINNGDLILRGNK
ncbi:MAG: hypothetical protein LBT45_01080 [Rickettsiales bacterium]|jgi:hypothetical protein|nr:hypothetical protein [Rickettsiales bacterium]